MRNSIIEASTYTTKSIHVCFLPCFLLHLFLLIFALIVIACYFFVVKMFIISYCCHCWFLSVNVVHWLILLCYIKWSDITCYLILQFIIVLIYNISWIIKWFVVFRNVFKIIIFSCVSIWFTLVHRGSGWFMWVHADFPLITHTLNLLWSSFYLWTVSRKIQKVWSAYVKTVISNYEKSYY